MEEQETPSTYELTLLINPDLSEFDVQKVIDKIKTIIDTQKGKLIKDYSWGKKQLAYPITKAEFGHYHTVIFTLLPETVNDLIKELQLAPEILRYLTISLDKEGVVIDQLFNPEKEAAVVSSAVIEKTPVKAISRKPIAPKKPTAPPKPPVDTADKETKRKELDQKIDELLKKDIK